MLIWKKGAGALRLIAGLVAGMAIATVGSANPTVFNFDVLPKPKIEVPSAETNSTVPKLPAVRLSKAPIIDGVLNPEEWGESVKAGPLKDRFTGQIPRDQTFVYIGYDDKNLYVGWKCFDAEPAKIVGREVMPNSRFEGEDTVTLDINTFGTKSWDQLSEFIVNSLGTQTERIAGGRAGKREWRGDWQAKTKIDADGWTCEIAIPWTMLNYPAKEKFTMDLNFIRRQGRSLQEQSWANVRPNPLPELLGDFEDVQPPKAPKPRVQTIAYSAAEVNQGVFQNRVGVDARYPFTNALNGLVSIAPDFRNVEDVVAPIDFIRTERFLGENRPFFNEGDRFFRLSDSFSLGNMFYTRRIGAFDVGAKMYGQINPKLAMGALYTNTLDGQKSTVFNLRNSETATQTYNVYTTSNYNRGVQNTSHGISFKDRYDTIGVAFDLATEQSTGTEWDSAGSFSISYTRPTTFVVARYIWVEPTFSPDLAFIPWQNRRGGYIYGNYEREYRTGPWREFGFNVNVNDFRTYEGEIQQQGYSVGAYISDKQDRGATIGRSRSTFFGSLDETTSISTGVNITNRFKQLNFAYTWGTLQDQPAKFYSLNGSYRIRNNFDVAFSYALQELGGTNRQTVLTTLYQVSRDELLTSRTVINDGNSNTYFAYRKAGLKGAEYYFIYGDPNAARTQSRFSIKVVWAF